MTILLGQIQKAQDGKGVAAALIQRQEVAHFLYHLLGKRSYQEMNKQVQRKNHT